MPKFQLLAGTHNDGTKTYGVGEIIDTPLDLNAIYNPPTFPPKFRRISGEDQVQAPTLAAGAFVFDPAKETFEQFARRVHGSSVSEPEKTSEPRPRKLPAAMEQLSVKELQQLAEEEEIDVRGAKSKDDLIRILRAAQA